MDGTAIVVCDDLFATANGKTAHGLVRGTERYEILGVIDGPTASRDAGAVLDGVDRGIPVFATIADALRALPRKPDFCVVGVATSGGRVTPVRSCASKRSKRDVRRHTDCRFFPRREKSAAAAGRGVSIRDVRRQTSPSLHFWSGATSRSKPPPCRHRTDCARGKSTTARSPRGLPWSGNPDRARFTGQRLDCREPFGFVPDSVPKDFVSGELEPEGS